MPRGRTPKSAAEKALAGNPGKRPLGVEAAFPPGAALRCPKGLGRHGKALWRRLVPILLDAGLLTVADRWTLEAACQCWEEVRVATLALAEVRRAEGRAGQADPRDLVQQQRSALVQWRAYSALFGLDPSARVRVKAPGKGDEPEDELEALERRARAPA